MKTMLRRIYAMLAVAALVLLAAVPVKAEVLLYETFNYEQGSKLNGGATSTSDNTNTADATTGWRIHSGGNGGEILVGAPLSFAGYIASGIGGSALLYNNGQDINKQFASQASGSTVYCAFMFQAQTSNFEGYFLNLLKENGLTSFTARTFVNAAGTGIGVSNGTAPSTYATITAGTTYLAVIKHSVNSTAASAKTDLFVFSTLPSSEPVTPDATYTGDGQAPINSIALRQYNANEKVAVGGIRVATTWADAIGGAVVDTDAPVFAEGYPQTDELLATSVKVLGKVNETATMYYAFYTSAQAGITAAIVKAGTGAAKNGNVAMSANTEATASVTGLTANTPYYAYVVAEDASGNITDVKPLTFSTPDAASPYIILGADAVSFETAMKSSQVKRLPYEAGNLTGDLNIAVAGKSAALFSAPATRTVNGKDTINITYSPLAAGKDTALLVLSNAALAKNDTVRLYGVAQKPVIALGTAGDTVQSFSVAVGGTANRYTVVKGTNLIGDVKAAWISNANNAFRLSKATLPKDSVLKSTGERDTVFFNPPAKGTYTARLKFYSEDADTLYVRFVGVCGVSAGDIIITQVYGAGGNSGAVYNADYVELFNPSTSDISLDGWSLQYSAATSTSNMNVFGFPANTVIKGRHFFLIRASDPGNNGVAIPSTPDFTCTANLAAASGKVALVSSRSAVAITTANYHSISGVVDLVAFGANASMAPSGISKTGTDLSTTTAAKRILEDGGNFKWHLNSVDGDFETLAVNGDPTVRNSAESIPVGGAPYFAVSPSAVNMSMLVGYSNTSIVQVTGRNLSASATVSIKGGAGSKFTVDKTTLPQNADGDTLRITFAPTAVGTVVDTLLLVAGTTTRVVPLTGVGVVPSKTIYDVRYTTNPDGKSPYKDSIVTVTGVVTGVTGLGYFIQQGAGAFTGVYAYENKPSVFEVGDSVVVTGKVNEYAKAGHTKTLTELENLTLSVKVGTGTIPAAAQLQSIRNMVSEYESVLVKFAEDVTVTRERVTGGTSFLVGNDSTPMDTMQVYNYMYNYAAALDSRLHIGGVGYLYNDLYCLIPRSADDIQMVTGEVKMSNVTVNGRSSNAGLSNDSVFVVPMASGTALTSFVVTFSLSGGTPDFQSGSSWDFNQGPLTVNVDLNGVSHKFVIKVQVGATGVGKELAEKVKVYPNPVSSGFSIQAPYAVIKVELVSSTGALEMEEFTQDYVNVEGLSAGTHFVRITFDNGKQVVKQITKK